MAAERLVVDASVVVKSLLAGPGSAPLRRYSLHAPTLLWSEVASALSQLLWRSEINQDDVRDALRRLAETRITAHKSAGLIGDAVALAHQLGWAKTYDAEYVALAKSLRAPLMTLDARLARSIASTVEIADLKALDS